MGQPWGHQNSLISQQIRSKLREILISRAKINSKIDRDSEDLSIDPFAVPSVHILEDKYEPPF